MSLRRFLLCLFLLLAFVATAHGSASLRIGAFAVEPISYLGDDGSVQGLYPDLIREIAAEEGWQVVFVPGSISDCFKWLKNGEIDVLAPMAFTAERSELYDYNRIPVIEVWGQVYVQPGSTVTSFSDLEGQRVGIVPVGISGRNYIKTADELGVKSETVNYASFDEVFQAVADGEVVAGVAPQHYGASRARAFDLVPNTIKFCPQSLHFATLKGKLPTILEQFDIYLERWKNDPDSVYYQKVNFWINGQEHKRPLFRWILSGLIGAIACVLLLSYLNRVLRHRTKTLSAEGASESLARRKAEESLAERERLYRLSHFSIEHSHSAMVWLNLKGDVTDFNRKFCDYTGYAREDLLKMSAETICESCATQIREMDQSGDNMDSIQIEEDLRCKDGSFMPALIEVSRFSFEGEEMLLAVVTDITRRKRAEEVQAQLEVELRQSHKMEAIGTLAGGIAHDFNNILTSMIGCTEMAINRSVDDEQLTKYLGVVRDGERRAAELVAQILAFARQDDNTIKKPLRLNETVSEAMKLLRASIPSTVAIKMSLPDECPEILANSSQLLQVIINLVTNAYQALSDDQGCLHISLDVEEVTTTQAATYLQITPGAYLVLCVADNGCGISEEDLDRVFDPYFTTRELGAGTGFGLSIVKRMVSSHDGMVIVESTLGQGSEFKVYLPILNRGSAS